MRTRYGAAVAILLLAAGCVESGAPERTTVTTDTADDGEAGEAGEAGVPIRLAGPGGAALIVPVRINGSGPYDFVFDTGATLTCLDAALADSLRLPEASGTRGIGGGIQGPVGAIRLVEIDSVAVGTALAEGLTGCALDLEQLRTVGIEVHGLLGLNFLTSFRVTLDFEAERLTLAE